MKHTTAPSRVIILSPDLAVDSSLRYCHLWMVESSCKDNIAPSMSVEEREVGSQGDINDMECADSGAENVSHDETSNIEFDKNVDERNR